MFKKIITYFLIIAVVAPVLSAVPLGVSLVFAQTSDYTDMGGYETYTSTYKNSAGNTVTRMEYKSSDGSGTVYEEYAESGGVKHRRMGNYESDENYDNIRWQETNGENGNYSKSSNNNSGSSETGNSNSVSGNGDGSGTGSEADYSEEMKSPCGPFFIRFGPQCIGYGLTWLVYTAFFMPSYFITYAAGSIFNASIGFSLTSEAFPSGENSMIATGWTIMRDLINLFFIFILLYIAISTILQYGSFGKDVIVKLIIAAVLINFSLMITKAIIDSSHVLAWNFYDKIDVRNMEKRGDKEIKTDMPNDIEIKKFKIKNLASVFYAGFNPQRLIVPSNSGEEPMVTMYSHARQKGATIKDVWWKMFLIIILAVVLNLVAAFVLFAGAIMFIIRVVVLWFVLILSPLAFAGMITPKFQKYSSQWWDKLISQAFFAPAFLFMFYLVTILVNDNFLQSIIIGASDSASASILGIDPSSTIVVFFHFIVVGGLLVGCLWIAQQMGAHGASGFMGAFDKGKKWVTDKVKRGASKPFRVGGEYAQYGTKIGIGALSDKLASSNGWFANSIKKLPGMERVLQEGGKLRQEEKKKEEKKGEKYYASLSEAGKKSFDAGGGQAFMTRYAVEGAEKAIAKKAEEEKEKDLYHESWAYLLGDLEYGKDYGGEEGKKEIKNAVEKIKGRIKRGELGKMEEEFEEKQKTIEKMSEEKKEGNNLEITKKNREIRRLEAELVEQRKSENSLAGLTESTIHGLDQEISSLNKLNNQIMVMDKIMERHEKKVNSYRARQESKSKPSEEKKSEKKKD